MSANGTWKAPNLHGQTVSAWGMIAAIGRDGVLDPQPTDERIISEMQRHPDFIFEVSSPAPQSAEKSAEAAPAAKPAAKSKTKAKAKAKKS